MSNRRPKYEMTDEQHARFPQTRRIRALVDIDYHGVREGDLGGFIEDEQNLSHEGKCWVASEAVVLGQARVEGNAEVRRRAVVRDYALVNSEAYVGGDAVVEGNAKVTDSGIVLGRARITDHACISGHGKVKGDVIIEDEVQVRGIARLGGEVTAMDGCVFEGLTELSGNASVRGYAHITCNNDIVVISPIGSEGGTLTAYRDAGGGIYVTRGCFAGSLDEFRQAVERRHGDSDFGVQYRSIISYLEVRFGVGGSK